MIRITIETTTGEVSMGEAGGGERRGGTADVRSEAPQAVPAELAARAAAIGALSAGPAPDGPPLATGAPGFQPDVGGTPTTSALGQPVSGGGDQSAGAAPMAQDAAPGIEVSE